MSLQRRGPANGFAHCPARAGDAGGSLGLAVRRQALACNPKVLESAHFQGTRVYHRTLRLGGNATKHRCERPRTRWASNTGRLSPETCVPGTSSPLRQYSPRTRPPSRTPNSPRRVISICSSPGERRKNATAAWACEVASLASSVRVTVLRQSPRKGTMSFRYASPGRTPLSSQAWAKSAGSSPLAAAPQSTQKRHSARENKCLGLQSIQAHNKAAGSATFIVFDQSGVNYSNDFGASSAVNHGIRAGLR